MMKSEMKMTYITYTVFYDAHEKKQEWKWSNRQHHWKLHVFFHFVYENETEMYYKCVYNIVMKSQLDN